MKIAYIVPGTGGAFYCENCIRDCSMIQGLRLLGHEVTTVPMYLPLRLEEGVSPSDAPIFFGAMRLYLKERFPLLKRIPDHALRFLDSPAMLRIAASMASSTRAAGHEELTLSVLQGINGPLEPEFDRLARWMLETIRPDAVFLSNLFLSGIASALKAGSSVAVACLAQDEHTWVDSCRPAYRQPIWDAVTRYATNVDTFLTFSTWYRNQISALTGIAADRFPVIPFGVDPDRYRPASHAAAGSVAGFLGHICEDNGVDILAGAGQMLRNSNRIPSLQIKFCGGYTGDDRAIIKKITREGRDSVSMIMGIGLSSRVEFLSSLSLLSTPVKGEIALGTFLIEAMAAGVPVIQPDTGGFSEIVRETGAGVVYKPNTPEALAEAMAPLLTDYRLRLELGRRGQEAVKATHNHHRMVDAALSALKHNVSPDRICLPDQIQSFTPQSGEAHAL